MAEADLDCRQCPETLQRARGCRQPAKVPVHYFEGEDYFRCPAALLTSNSLRYAEFFSFFERGFLPVRGGLLDQPAKYLQAMKLLGLEKARIEAQKDKQARQEQARRQKSIS